MWKKYNITFTDGTSVEIITKGVVVDYPNTLTRSEVDYPEYEQIIQNILSEQTK